MYILFDVIPLTKSTGGSRRFEGRRYYFLPYPAVQFVTRGFDFSDIELGQVYDANVSDDKCSVALDVLTVPATKITLRRIATEALKPVSLSRLLIQIAAQDLSGVFVSLTHQEREKLNDLSKLPHEAIKTLIFRA